MNVEREGEPSVRYLIYSELSTLWKGNFRAESGGRDERTYMIIHASRGMVEERYGFMGFRMASVMLAVSARRPVDVCVAHGSDLRTVILDADPITDD